MGKWDLPLYLSQQVPPNTLQLVAPDPSGSFTINPPAASQDVLISLDLRHFYNLISTEIKLLRESEFQSLARSTVIDLTEDHPDPQSLDIPIEQIIMVETLLEFSQSLLQSFILWDWQAHTSYYNATTIYTDSLRNAYQSVVDRKFAFSVEDPRFPEIFDLLCTPVPKRVRNLGCEQSFTNIKRGVGSLSRMISNLGLKHPPVFDLVKNEDFLATH